MPRNGSGQYNALTNTWNPPVTGVLATGADFQAQLNDISAAITQSVSKDGQTPMTGNLPMGNNSIVGIASGTETSPSISANGDTNTGLYFPAADTVAIATGGVKRVEVDANGNVGVGVTPSNAYTPGKVLQIVSGGVTLYGSSTTTSLGNNFNLDVSGNSTYQLTQAASRYQQDGGAHKWFTAPSGTAGNPITFTQAMTLTSNGNLLVGTTSATDPNIKMEVVNSGITGCYLANNPTSAGTNHTLFAGRAIGVDRFWVLGNGNVANQNNSYGGISDAKLKENIVDTAPKLDSLLKVRVVNYSLKTDPQFKQIGVIAQELEQIFPSMIEEMPDRDDEGNDLGTVTKSVKYSVFVPMLIKAMQEQQALIESQKTAIESLTARIAALEAK